MVPVHFKSYKARRVFPSAMAGEVTAFSDMFDTAATLAVDLMGILRKKDPVKLLTDSKYLFDIISKS